MARVTYKNIYKIYQNTQSDGSSYPVNAVSDFNLEIKDGELIVLLGPSGCGKTSTMFMVAGLEEITKGELYIDDILVNNVHPKDRGIAMMFHNYALFPFMTAFDNIAFGLKPTALSEYEIKGRVYEVAEILDIACLLDRKPDKLSGGQKQRVALARALVRKNKVVCLDEPLSNLDARLRASMRVELIKLHKKFETTFIYVTHDQDEAMTIADRIVIMRDGFIHQVGTPEELYYSPCNMFVAGFFGTPQMNFLETTLSENNGEIYINLGELKIKLPEGLADRAGAYIDKRVIAGIRPEDLFGWENVAVEIPHLAVIEANVQVREFIGDRIYFHCESGGFPFNITVLSQFNIKNGVVVGDIIKVGLNPEKIYLFDKETELAI